ncbi:unnamed protein product [Brassica rapa subsp. narinosa]
MIIYVSEVYWREGKVNKTKALILSPLKKKMSEKKLVFVSIASPNNLTPTSEKQACAHYYKRSKMMLGNQSKPYQTNFEIDRFSSIS